MKILVTGVGGQLGYDVCRELQYRKIEYYSPSSKEMDLTDPSAIRSQLNTYAPDAVIHCTAYTAVDCAEDDHARCYAVNEKGTRNLAEYCKEWGAKLLYISTDYVFPGAGDQPYEINSLTGPLNVYGASKLAGEEAVRELVEAYFIVRISWVFGIHGKNFVRTMLDIGKKNSVLRITGDQFGSPTYTRDLAPLLCDMIMTKKYGTYHATNEGVCSWAQFAQEIFDQAGMSVQVTPRAAAECPSRAARPSNSRMSKQSLDDNGFARLPPWQNALKRYLDELRQAQ